MYANYFNFIGKYTISLQLAIYIITKVMGWCIMCLVKQKAIANINLSPYTSNK